MKKCYLCHSGGYDSTLLLYELCKNAKHNNEELEIFPVYLKSTCRPSEPEIFHANKSIKYFFDLYKYDKVIIHPLKVLDYGEIKFNDVDNPNEFNVNLHYYSHFLVNVAQTFNRKDVTDVFFAFHQGDAIFSYVKDFETAVNALRRLSFFNYRSSPVGIGNDLFWVNNKDLSFHYPFSTIKKDSILRQYLEDPILIDQHLAFACECRCNGYTEENNSYISDGWCDKCKEIRSIYYTSNAAQYFFNKIKKDQIKNEEWYEKQQTDKLSVVDNTVEEVIPTIDNEEIKAEDVEQAVDDILSEPGVKEAVIGILGIKNEIKL